MLHMFYLFLCSRQNVHNWMIFAWACRLGTFLFMRVLKEGQDKRFDKARDSPATFLVFWSLQGVWVWVTLLPSLILNTERRDPALGARDYLGWGLWVAGFLIEVVADMQKSIFRANPENDVSSIIFAVFCNMKGIYPVQLFMFQGKFISSGLWSLSRHPNYFGEILLWFGIYISSSSAFRGSQYLSVLSPVFIFLLITRVSGEKESTLIKIIKLILLLLGVPLLEKSGLKKWGHLPEYQKYLQEVPQLVPFTRP